MCYCSPISRESYQLVLVTHRCARGGPTTHKDTAITVSRQEVLMAATHTPCLSHQPPLNTLQVGSEHLTGLELAGEREGPSNSLWYVLSQAHVIAEWITMI